MKMSDMSNNEMNYPEQLLTAEWKSCRNKIISRDNNCCCFCGKGNSVKVFDLYLGINHSLSKIICNDSNIRLTHLKITDYIRKNWQYSKIKKGTIPGSQYMGILTAEGMFMYTTWKKKDTSHIDIKNEAFVAEVILNEGSIVPVAYVNEEEMNGLTLPRIYIQNSPVSLQVHHKQYFLGKKAWEYDDEYLVTLCGDCHTKVHENIPIHYYEYKNGRYQALNYTPCQRCNGTGYFPEYDYVENGICFRCRGARFEELIKQYDDDIFEE